MRDRGKERVVRTTISLTPKQHKKAKDRAWNGRESVSEYIGRLIESDKAPESEHNEKSCAL